MAKQTQISMDEFIRSVPSNIQEGTIVEENGARSLVIARSPTTNSISLVSRAHSRVIVMRVYSPSKEGGLFLKEQRPYVSENTLYRRHSDRLEQAGL